MEKADEILTQSMGGKEEVGDVSKERLVTPKEKMMKVCSLSDSHVVISENDDPKKVDQILDEDLIYDADYCEEKKNFCDYFFGWSIGSILLFLQPFSSFSIGDWYHHIVLYSCARRLTFQDWFYQFWLQRIVGVSMWKWAIMVSSLLALGGIIAFFFHREREKKKVKSLVKETRAETVKEVAKYTLDLLDLSIGLVGLVSVGIVGLHVISRLDALGKISGAVTRCCNLVDKFISPTITFVQGGKDVSDALILACGRNDSDAMVAFSVAVQYDGEYERNNGEHFHRWYLGTIKYDLNAVLHTELQALKIMNESDAAEKSNERLKKLVKWTCGPEDASWYLKLWRWSKSCISSIKRNVRDNWPMYIALMAWVMLTTLVIAYVFKDEWISMFKKKKRYVAQVIRKEGKFLCSADDDNLVILIDEDHEKELEDIDGFVYELTAAKLPDCPTAPYDHCYIIFKQDDKIQTETHQIATFVTEDTTEDLVFRFNEFNYHLTRLPDYVSKEAKHASTARRFRRSNIQDFTGNPVFVLWRDTLDKARVKYGYVPDSLYMALDELYYNKQLTLDELRHFEPDFVPEDDIQELWDNYNERQDFDYSLEESDYNLSDEEFVNDMLNEQDEFGSGHKKYSDVYFECIHSKDCPKGLKVHAKTKCGVKCDGKKCVHLAGCLILGKVDLNSKHCEGRHIKEMCEMCLLGKCVAGLEKKRKAVIKSEALQHMSDKKAIENKKTEQEKILFELQSLKSKFDATVSELENTRLKMAECEKLNIGLRSTVDTLIKKYDKEGGVQSKEQSVGEIQKDLKVNSSLYKTVEKQLVQLTEEEADMYVKRNNSARKNLGMDEQIYSDLMKTTIKPESSTAYPMIKEGLFKDKVCPIFSSKGELVGNGIGFAGYLVMPKHLGDVKSLFYREKDKLCSIQVQYMGDIADDGLIIAKKPPGLKDWQVGEPTNIGTIFHFCEKDKKVDYYNSTGPLFPKVGEHLCSTDYTSSGGAVTNSSGQLCGIHMNGDRSGKKDARNGFLVFTKPFVAALIACLNSNKSNVRIEGALFRSSQGDIRPSFYLSRHLNS